MLPDATEKLVIWHELNAFVAILVHDCATVNAVNPELLNAEPFIVSTFGNEIDERPEQPEKAFVPTLVTFEKERDVNLLQY